MIAAFLKRNLSAALVIVALILFTALPAFAQTYSFAVEKETVHVLWESDGTLSLAYEILFVNSTFADPIDFVDVGMPNADYSLSNIHASVNGISITQIAYSPYVENGVELGLGGNAIPSGQAGVVRVQVSGIRNVLFEDSKDSSYASGVFSPSWFDSQFVNGTTDLTVIFHLPPGVGSEEPRYHTPPSGWPAQPSAGFDEQGRITYSWRNKEANAYSQYLFGASFPASYVPSGTISKPTFWQNIGIDLETLIGYSFFCVILGIIFGLPILSIYTAKKRKLQYLPPKIAIEGHGIKRGLTAIEAGILLEQPIDKILTMMLFAVIKKDAATVESKDPLTIKVTEELPKKLRTYEVNFLDSMKLSSKTKRRKALQKTMVKLVRSVTKKMKGFSRRETKKYYRDIMEKAWDQVEKAGTPEIRSEKFDKVMEWTMLDKNYGDRTRDVFRHQPVFLPHWWRRYDPVYRSSSLPRKSSSPSSRPTPGGTKLPHLPGSDFAASIVTGVQDFSAGVIGSVSDFTSGITKTTNPPPKPSSSSYRSGGGGSSCACACACAGCACACAGGGR